jgi:DNA-binding transcriptional LysR family regulator
MNTVRRADLGLLYVLVAIEETRSVSAAASRLSLSQPAVSQSLKRLRDITQDRLFEREGQQMVPTPIAMQMVQVAREVISRGASLLSPQVFDPASDKSTWRIAVSEYALTALGGTLLRKMTSLSPAVRVNFLPVTQYLVEDMLAHKIDFAFMGDGQDETLYAPLVREELFQDHYIGVMPATHPLAAKARNSAVTLEDWLRFPHIRFGNATPGVSSIDRKLAQLHRTREIAVISQSHRENIELLRGTSRLLALPSRLRFIVDDKNFVLFGLPVDIPPYPYYLLYHQRVFGSPATAYMRKLILDLFKECP